MNYRRKWAFGLLCLLLAILCQGCRQAESKYHPGGPYYYGDWAHYLLPFRPVDEMTLDQVKKAEESGTAYHEAHFNQDGHIMKFKKHYRGKVEFEVTYYYENGILKRSESTNSKGQKQTDLYDAKGKIIKR